MPRYRAHPLQLLLVVCTLLSCASLAGSMCISCQSVAYLESGSSCGEGFTALSNQMCDGGGTSSYFCDDVSPWGSVKGRKLLDEQQPQQQQAAEAVPTGSSSTEQVDVGDGSSSTGSSTAAGAVDSSQALASGYYRRKYRRYHQNTRGGGTTGSGYCSSAGRRLAQAATDSQQTAEVAGTGAATAAEQQAQGSLILVGDRVSYDGSYVTYGYDYGRPQLCQITQGYRTSSGYLCGCLCIKQAPPIPPTPPPTPAASPTPPVVPSPMPPSPTPKPSPGPIPVPASCKLPDDVVGQPCRSPPTKLPPNIDSESVSSCSNTASGTFCWASCAVGYLASSAPLQSQCCNGQWLQWKGGTCTAGSPCLSPPAFEADDANVTSVQGCVNRTSGEFCVASCAANFTEGDQPPTAVCDNGDWTDWTGSCVPVSSDNTTEGNSTEGNSTVQRGTTKASLPEATTTKPSRVPLCSTDQLPLAPAGSTGWMCAQSTSTNRVEAPGALPTLSGLTLARGRKRKRQQQQQQPQDAALADLLVSLPGHQRQQRQPRQRMQPAAQQQGEVQQARSCSAQCRSASVEGAAVTIACTDGKWGKPQGSC